MLTHPFPSSFKNAEKKIVLRSEATSTAKDGRERREREREKARAANLDRTCVSINGARVFGAVRRSLSGKRLTRAVRPPTRAMCHAPFLARDWVAASTASTTIGLFKKETQEGGRESNGMRRGVPASEYVAGLNTWVQNWGDTWAPIGEKKSKKPKIWVNRKRNVTGPRARRVFQIARCCWLCVVSCVSTPSFLQSAVPEERRYHSGDKTGPDFPLDAANLAPVPE